MLPVASAIANVVEDAVGVRVTELPLTPERVLAALEAARRRYGALLRRRRLIYPTPVRKTGRGGDQ